MNKDESLMMQAMIQCNKKLEFKKFKVGDIVSLKLKDRRLTLKKIPRKLDIFSGTIISTSQNCIIVQDCIKEYNKFTLNLNSFITGDIIIKKIKEEVNEKI